MIVSRARMKRSVGVKTVSCDDTVLPGTVHVGTNTKSDNIIKEITANNTEYFFLLSVSCIPNQIVFR